VSNGNISSVLGMPLEKPSLNNSETSTALPKQAGKASFCELINIKQGFVI
jgi:hypothetical protein